MNVLSLIGRQDALFSQDIQTHEAELTDKIRSGRFLVIGGAGTIGQAVAKEIFKRDPKLLHVVDISENNLVELVRDIRSTIGYGTGDFRTFAIDCGGVEFEALMRAQGGYDYIFNLSALKHVRSERDPFTLMRLVQVNILNTLKTFDLAQQGETQKYFCVSTDKAANPVSMMGASKRIAEKLLFQKNAAQNVSLARFANVAFSDGSLLHGFNHRFSKRQPLSAPRDIRRYFVTEKESGELCLLSGLFGQDKEIFFPKLDDTLHLSTFSEIAVRFLAHHGFDAKLCDSEDEARARADELIPKGQWPCYFFDSDTSGEKPVEEFFTDQETPDFERFSQIGVLTSSAEENPEPLQSFLDKIGHILDRGDWAKEDLVQAFETVLPEFSHLETGSNLDQKM